jgi:hypothetical protein
MGDYGFPERRKNKNDRKAKRKFNVFKKGGHFREGKLELNSRKEEK